MSLFCMHADVVRPDERSEGVCTACGTVLGPAVMTEQSLLEGLEAMRRHPHRRSCVEVERGVWVCAETCPVNRRRR